MSTNAKLDTSQENGVDQWNTHTFYVLFVILHTNTARISTHLASLGLCASQRLVCCLPQGAYEFCQ
jgi:hypothetical protein